MAIILTNIYKAYDSTVVFEDFSCHFDEGTVTCIMGTSGRGKTTLLRILAGLENVDDGKMVANENWRRSMVFQEDRLCESLSAIANIRLVCRKPVAGSDILEAMAAVDLDSLTANQAVRSMSGGQRRRVAILRALIAEYDLLLLDEPFKELDVETKEKVIHYTKEMTQGKTVVLVTHDEKECELMGGQLIKL
ncbi:MAG: ATP-binding cassette domain-containing protein [Lachnospiraceae bacterium]|jgi:NitT/TauT family transport system ATP-binding protein|nr:ATP-binding cassette domain-containing protein [Lachnospiraceae bacterium]